MMTKTYSIQNEVSVVILEDLVPKDHLLRKIDRVMDFNFIYDYVEDLYSSTGRPSIDPVVLIKLAFIDKLYGYHSMRKTCAEAEVNLAIKWFLGYGLEEKTPHFSDFSKTYSRKFGKEIDIKDKHGNIIESKTIFAIIFDMVLEEAFKRRYLEPAHLYMDSTHIKANANKKKIFKKKVTETRKHFQDELDKEIEEECKERGYKIPKDIEFNEKEIKISSTDEEAGIFHKGEHEIQVAYLAQTVCDINGFIVTTEVVPANLHDSTTFYIPFNEAVEKVKNMGKEVKSMGLDAGYKNPAIARELIKNGITPLLPYTRPKGKKNNEDNPVKLGKRDFIYDKAADVFHGPTGCIASPRGMDKKTGYVIYRTSKKECDNCPLRNRCLSKAANTKTVVRHLWQDNLDEAERIRLTEYWSRFYPLRSMTIERVFADAKEKHGLRFTRVKGIKKVKDDTLITFATMNLKKIALWSWNSLDSAFENIINKAKQRKENKVLKNPGILTPCLSTV